MEYKLPHLVQHVVGHSVQVLVVCDSHTCQVVGTQVHVTHVLWEAKSATMGIIKILLIIYEIIKVHPLIIY